MNETAEQLEQTEKHSFGDEIGNRKTFANY